MNKVILDIDDTIWDLWTPWYVELEKINPKLPKGQPDRWEFYEGYMTLEEVMAAVDIIHMKQDIYPIWQGVVECTKFLKDNGFGIDIVSHRIPESRAVTEKWLNHHGVEYDNLYCESNKKPFFEDASIVIDDSPFQQQVALELGVPCFSVVSNYNQHMEKEGVAMFPTFFTLFSGIKSFICGNNC